MLIKVLGILFLNSFYKPPAERVFCRQCALETPAEAEPTFCRHAEQIRGAPANGAAPEYVHRYSRGEGHVVHTECTTDFMPFDFQAETI